MASRSQHDPHPLTVVAADLKAIGAPAAVTADLMAAKQLLSELSHERQRI